MMPMRLLTVLVTMPWLTTWTLGYLVSMTNIICLYITMLQAKIITGWMVPPMQKPGRVVASSSTEPPATE